MATGLFQRILAPVNLSTCSRAALELACKLAAPLGSKIEVLFVRQSVTPQPNELAAAREELHRFVASVPGTPQTSITERVEDGDPQVRIVAIAEEGGFDAIVLGTHGRTGRARSLAGSTAESVVRNAGCPVITVREPR